MKLEEYSYHLNWLSLSIKNQGFRNREVRTRNFQEFFVYFLFIVFFYQKIIFMDWGDTIWQIFVCSFQCHQRIEDTLVTFFSTYF